MLHENKTCSYLNLLWISFYIRRVKLFWKTQNLKHAPLYYRENNSLNKNNILSLDNLPNNWDLRTKFVLFSGHEPWKLHKHDYQKIQKVNALYNTKFILGITELARKLSSLFLFFFILFSILFMASKIGSHAQLKASTTRHLIYVVQTYDHI